MPRYKRQKASDVFRDTEFLFGRKVGFEEAFPDIRDITVKVEQSGDGVDRWNETRHFSKHSIGEYFDCANSLCYNGGVRIGSIVRNMEFSNETHYEDSLSCQGYEGSPKGRRNYGPCFNRFKITVDIEYEKSDSDSN